MGLQKESAKGLELIKNGLTNAHRFYRFLAQSGNAILRFKQFFP
jgi:hypothetical protein